MSKKSRPFLYTVWPRSSDPFYIVNYYIKWITTPWTDSMTVLGEHNKCTADGKHHGTDTTAAGGH